MTYLRLAPDLLKMVEKEKFMDSDEISVASRLSEVIATLTTAGAIPLSPRRLRACLKKTKSDQRAQLQLVKAANTLWCLQGVTCPLLPDSWHAPNPDPNPNPAKGSDSLPADETIKDVALLFLEALQHESTPLKEVRAAFLTVYGDLSPFLLELSRN